MAEAELTPAAAPAGEAELIAALRGGDEAAFVALVERYQSALLRVAQMYVVSRGHS